MIINFLGNIRDFKRLMITWRMVCALAQGLQASITSNALALLNQLKISLATRDRNQLQRIQIPLTPPSHSNPLHLHLAEGSDQASNRP
jgi:hypothetical protein